ncbi:MAG: penicillin-binding protein activator [Myxococcota bacterium]|nr:penicillin-binding protein activator [Myxococcota bacterium]
MFPDDRPTRRALLSRLLFGAAALGLSPGSAFAQAPDTSRTLPLIGLLVPLSGDLGAVGEQLAEAATLAAKDARVDLQIVDSASDPGTASKAVASLAGNPRLVGIIGPLGARTARAAAASARHAAVPLLMLASVERTEFVSNWVFRLRLSPGELGAMIAREAAEKLEIESAAVMFPGNEYCEQAALAFVQSFTSKKKKITAAVRYSPELEDFRKPLDELVGRKLWVGRGVKVDGRRGDRDGYISLAGAPAIGKGVDFQALFIPDFHTRVSKILPLLSTAGMQSGAGGKGVAVQLLGMPGWHGEQMRLTRAHAAGALYFDPYGGENTGGRAEEFALLFESTTGRRPVDLEAEVFDAVTLLARTASKHWSLTGAPDIRAVRAKVVADLPAPKRPWRGVCGDWAFNARGTPERTLSLYRFDVDGAVMLVD